MITSDLHSRIFTIGPISFKVKDLPNISSNNQNVINIYKKYDRRNILTFHYKHTMLCGVIKRSNFLYHYLKYCFRPYSFFFRQYIRP